VNSIASWLLGQALRLASKKVEERLFSESLVTRLRSAAEQWRAELPEGQLLAIEALLPESPNEPSELPPPAPSELLARLAQSELPDANAWTEALFEQWARVRATVLEPQEFFLLSEPEARNQLAELGKRLERECQRDSALFRVKALEMLGEIKAKIDSQLETRQIATPQQLPNPVTTGSMTDAKARFSGAYHGEIDAAAALTKAGSPDVAIAQLQALRNRHWDELSDRERFRVLANLGHAYSAKDEYKDAGQQYIECKRYQPHDEIAQSLEAAGYAVLGDPARAFELVRQVTQGFPTCDLAWATYVRNSPAQIPFDDLEGAVPAEVRIAIETSCALCWRALHSARSGAAEKYARSALEREPNARLLLEQLGIVLYEMARQEAAGQYTDTPTLTDLGKLREADSLLTRALGLTPQALVSARARVRYYRGLVSQLLGQWDEAFEHLQAAFDSDPHNPQFVLQFALALSDRKQTNRAIEILDTARAHDDSGAILALQASLLAVRDEGGDRSEAIRILSERLPTLTNMTKHARAELVSILVELHCRAGHYGEAASALGALPPDSLNHASLHALHSVRLRREGRLEEAKEEAHQAARDIATTDDRRDRRRVAVELTALGLFDDALPIWRSLVTPSYLGLDTPAIIQCAVKAGDIRYAAEFCRDLRSNGFVVRDLLHLELNILLEYDCFNRAIEVMQRHLASAPESDLTKEIRARLSNVAINIGRTELAEFKPERLPAPSTVEPSLGLSIAQILGHGPEPLDGLRFAYELVRRHFDSHLAHMAMVVSVLFGRRADLRLPDPKVAGPGTAVRYKEDDTEKCHWHIIEDSPSPDSARNEFSPEHGLSKALSGKGAGDQFFLRKDSVQQRTATVVEVWSKYKLRFNLCMEEWEKRFPEQYFLWKFAIKKDDHDRPDITPILRSVDQQAEDVRRCKDVYRRNPLSVTNFAVFTGQTVLDAVQHVATKPELLIRCCEGTDENYISAEAALASGAPLMLDGTALATLFLTGAYSHLPALGVPLKVSEGTLQEWRKRYVEKLNSPREGRFLSKSDNQYVFMEESADAVEARVGEQRRFIEWIQQNVELEEGMPLADVTREQREKMISLVGRAAAESIAIALSEGFVLWTDDISVAAFAAGTGGVERVWTDSVFRWASAQGKVSLEAKNELVLKLAQMGYFYTRIDRSVALWSAERAQWNVADPAFGALLDWFANPFTKREGITGLGAQLLEGISQNADEFRVNMVVTQLLTRIAQRPDGTQILRKLYGMIGGICGLDVVGAQRLRQLFQLLLQG